MTRIITIAVPRMAWLPVLALALQACVGDSLDTRQFRGVGTEVKGPSAPAPAGQQAPALSPANAGQSVADTAAPQPIVPQTAGASPAPSSSAAAAGNDAASRERALAEIRAKAAHRSGQKTVIGAVPQAAGKQMSADEQQALQRELASELADQKTVISEGDVAAREAALRRLRARGKRHYQEAVEQIEE
ncbi:MAG: hypothetical protein KDJ80_01480 [Nitratireductor sp.]|nr:hypothetical protein [Nitratireductor sp.]